jgi:hypothetical protein
VQNSGGTGIENTKEGIIGNFNANFATLNVKNIGGEGINNTGTLENTGLLKIENSAPSSVGILNGGFLDNAGPVTVANSDGYGIYNWDFPVAATINNSGTIDIKNTESSNGIFNLGTITVENSGEITVANVGSESIGIDSIGTISNQGTILNNGLIVIQPGGTLNISGGILTTVGEIFISSNGIVYVGPDGTLEISKFGFIFIAGALLNEGTINNAGTINNNCGEFNNDGTFTGNPVDNICDSDHDWIADIVDTQPAIFSNDFSDKGIGGTTSGSITFRDQILTVRNAPNPDGVRIMADPELFGNPAFITACGGSAVYEVAFGADFIFTCGSVTTQVFQGPIDIEFFTTDGSTLIASATIEAGNTITYDPVTKSFTAGPDNTSSTNVILANGNTVPVDAGQTVQIWTLQGFYSPVDMNSVVNTIKAGQSVPLKFEVFAGTEEKTSTSDISSFTQKKISCSEFTGDPTDAVEELNSLGTGVKYDTTSGQFNANWKTPKQPNTCWKVEVTTADGSSLAAFFRLI